MITATTLRKENDKKLGGLGLFTSSKETLNTSKESPNLLRLIPRPVTCKGHASAKAKPSINRQIEFVPTGDLEILQIGEGVKELNSEEEISCINLVTPVVDNKHSVVNDCSTPTTACSYSSSIFTPVTSKVLNGSCNGLNEIVEETPKLSIKSKSLENGINKLENGLGKKSLVNGTAKAENGITKSLENGINKSSSENGIDIPKKTIIGPNAFKASSFPTSNSSNSEDQNISNPFYNQRPSTSQQLNGTTSTTNPSRKRVLSERCEQESQFPRVDRNTIFNSWDGFHLNGNNRCASGLINPLNNCFLNSVLQAVVHIPHLARMIIELNDLRMCRKSLAKSNNVDCFHCELKKHICRAIKSNSPLSTNWIQPFLRKIFPHHRNGVQEDAHEMLTLLLGALEIGSPKQPTMNGLKVHGACPSTPIEQIFGGNMRNQVVCNTCNTEHINYERIREMNLGLTRTYNADIEQLIDDFFKDEQLSNFLCSRCKKKQTATRHTFLLSAPYVLIIQIKRFNVYGGKNRTPVKANSIINLSKHSFRHEQFQYKLHGLIQHIGGGLNFGHYICAMRGFNNKEMFIFDDSERRSVPVTYVMNNMEPYILFYTRLPSSNNQIKPIPRRSFEGCQPNYAKQPRVENYNNNNSFIGTSSTSNKFNQTYGSFIH